MSCSQYWGSPYYVGSHRIAKILSSHGWRVAYISFPISLPHLLYFNKLTRLSQRGKIYWNSGITHPEGNLWAYVPGSVLAPFNASFLKNNWLHNNWHRLTFPNVIEMIAKKGFKSVDLLYFDNPYHNYLLDKILYTKSLYRMADDQSLFNHYNTAVERAERRLIESVDNIIYPSTLLHKRIPHAAQGKAQYFPNGVIYKDVDRQNCSLPSEYSTIKKPIAIFVGAMPAWFDHDLLRYASKELPGVSFVLIGDRSKEEGYRGLNNVYLLGPKDNADLPGYLNHADVGLLPFDVRGYPELVNGLNPLKMYEYFAAGLPVVATDWEEIRKINPPLLISRDSRQFVENIRTALTGTNGRERYRKYAKESDWERKIVDYFEQICNNRGPNSTNQFFN